MFLESVRKRRLFEPQIEPINIKKQYKFEVEYEPYIKDKVKHCFPVPQDSGQESLEIAIRKEKVLEPEWHPKWKLKRVICGHTGWVRCVSVDVGNEWFATGAGDRLIKVWDLASGELKLTLTGHICCVRGLEVSKNHPYLFSAGEDKMIKCWDLECNKVIRHYHGHISGIYSLRLHPTLDVLCTGGRDSTVRVWDMRTKTQIHVLTGHNSTVGSILTQQDEYQVISGSFDSTIRLWDLRQGKSKQTLTHHKKSVRALESGLGKTFVSGSPGSIKKWEFETEYPNSRFVHNFESNSIVNCLGYSDVLVSGSDNGDLCFYDYNGQMFQKINSPVQPGSLDSEAGIFALSFDQTGSRLITCEADKTIKIYHPFIEK